MAAKVGVFCLEGEWERDLADRMSVVSTLEHLDRLGEVKFIHRDVATREEMTYYFSRLAAARYKAYSIVYLAMHGDPGCLWLNSKDRTPVSLTELAEIIGDACTDRDIYFGSCSTIKAPRQDLLAFKKATKARLVCGYTRYVDWVESSAFEVLLFSALARARYRDGAEKYLKSAPLQAFTKKLGMIFV